jgi:hypothetical protein
MLSPKEEGWVEGEENVRPLDASCLSHIFRQSPFASLNVQAA